MFKVKDLKVIKFNSTVTPYCIQILVGFFVVPISMSTEVFVKWAWVRKSENWKKNWLIALWDRDGPFIGLDEISVRS